jgi:hypothetical protein
MWKYHHTALFLSATLAVTTLGAAAAYAQGGTDKTPPPRPPWVDADGNVKLDTAPREVPVVGPDGKYLKDAKGSDKMVPSHISETPAPPLR